MRYPIHHSVGGTAEAFELPTCRGAQYLSRPNHDFEGIRSFVRAIRPTFNALESENKHTRLSRPVSGHISLVCLSNDVCV